MRKLLLLAALTLCCFCAYAQKDTTGVLKFEDDSLFYDNEYLDTVRVRAKDMLNDYSMIGVNYGVSFNNMSFSPSKHQNFLFSKNYFSIMYTKYMKMFNYLPYFGFTIGLAHGYEGFLTKENKETGSYSDVDGATQLRMEVVEVPFMVEGHYDMDFFKLFADLGFYGGYRMNIERESVFNLVPEEYLHNFYPYEYRFDYGLQGGLGFSAIYDPFELRIAGLIRYSWQSLYTPDYESSWHPYNQYYYRYAYPFDINITIGLYIHLGKRYGKTTKMLKKEAYDIVYGKKDE